MENEFKELMKVLNRIADAQESNEENLERLIKLIENALKE